ISDKQIDKLIGELRNLAYNLWWSWNPDAQQLFHELSPFFWEHGNHNPVEVMNWISGAELRGKLQHQECYAKVNDLCPRFHAYMTK
ncbi:MAG: DUF3417 domain-containing protein, partial [Bacteroidota bacterium]